MLLNKVFTFMALVFSKTHKTILLSFLLSHTQLEIRCHITYTRYIQTAPVYNYLKRSTFSSIGRDLCLHLAPSSPVHLDGILNWLISSCVYKKKILRPYQRNTLLLSATAVSYKLATAQ